MERNGLAWRFMTTFTIPAAYQGITGIAHGGYVAGLLARHQPGMGKVRLRLPPPLDTPLAVSPVNSVVGLVDPKGRTVMELEASSPAEVQLPGVTIEEARERPPHPRFADHPYPDCFMCGSARDDGLGLRISAPDDTGLGMGVWTPSGALLGDADEVGSEFLWAAIDCLTVWSFADRWEEPDWWPAVTGQIAVEHLHPVKRDEPHVVAGRLVEREGRRVLVEGAITTAGGELCARGRAVWVVIPANPG